MQVEPREKLTEIIVLIHGLWMKGCVLIVLQNKIKKYGYTIKRFSYPTLGLDIKDNAKRLNEFLKDLQAEKIHLVGHSLGGLIIFELLANHSLANLGRIVLLGTPVQGSQVAKKLIHHCWGRILLRNSGPALIKNWQSSHFTDQEIGMIAGSWGFGVGMLFTKLNQPHDGMVSVQETYFPTAKDTLILPVTHTSMIFSSEVAKQVCYFLKEGRFDR